MDAFFPEGFVGRSVLLSATVAGFALGVLMLAGGALVLFDTPGLLTATTGVIATAVVALLVGLWVGAPALEAQTPPLRERWMVAALALAAAGAYATLLDLSEHLARGAAGRMGALLLLVAIPTYSLGQALSVLLAWGLQREEETEALEVGWGVPGALVVGVLGGMALGVVSSGLLLLPRFGAGPLLLGTAALLMVPLGLRQPESATAEERVLFRADTPFHDLRVTEVVYPGERQPERRLYLNGEEESGELVRSGAPTLAYVAAAESWLAGHTPRGSTYLFLGGGAYTLPRRVAERDSGARVTVVELDPDVTRAAYRFFGLRPEHRIRSIHGDARAFLEHAADAVVYDRIYLDVYGGLEALPYPLVTREAFLFLRRRLGENGVAAMNLIGVTHGSESPRVWSVIRTFADVFPAVALYTHLGAAYPERQNLLLAGSPDPDHVFPDQAGFFDRWPREQWPEIPAAVVYHDLLEREEEPRNELPPRSGVESPREPRGERSARSS